MKDEIESANKVAARLHDHLCFLDQQNESFLTHVHVFATRGNFDVKSETAISYTPDREILCFTLCEKSIYLYLFILPYTVTDILGRPAQRLLVSDRKRWIIVRFKS